MKNQKIVTRLLVLIAVSIFAGTAVSEVLADSHLPEELIVWKNHHSARSGAFTFLALSSVLLGVVAYICALFVQRWAAFVLLAHIATFVTANAIMGAHVYMGQTQSLFLLYTFAAGALVAVLLQKKEPNQPLQPTPGTGAVSNLGSPARRG